MVNNSLVCPNPW